MADRSNERDDQRYLYNRYKDLQKPSQTPLYRIPTSPEFLFQEEALVQRRSWGENLTYFTGFGYLGGAITGASTGFVQGIRAGEEGDTLKLRINRILNFSRDSGRKFGNRVGVIGLMYGGLESGLVAIRGDDDDAINSVVSGVGTGMLFRAGSGVRSAAVAGVLGGLMVGTAVAFNQFVKRM